MIFRKFNSFLQTNPFLLLLVLITTVLLVWGVTDNPPSLNWDEASHGYNAYSILKTGKDEWGNTFPLIFRAFGDYKLPLYIYLSVIPVALFGLNAFSVRLVSVLAGIIAIPLIYLLTNELFPDKQLKIWRWKLNLGTISAAVLTFTPWHFFISRPALEANLALTLVIGGLFALLRGLKNSRYYYLSAILLGLSLHAYNSARVFVPLALVIFLVIYFRQIKSSKPLIVSSLIFIGFLVTIGYQVLSGTGTARYNKLSYLSESSVFQIGQDRLNSNLPSSLARLIYNRPVYFAFHFFDKYLSYFSPAFFFQSQGAHSQFAIPGLNLLTTVGMILSLVGLIYTFKVLKDRSCLFLIGLFLLAPVPASLTIDPPHALRSLLMIPFLVIFSALALYALAKFKPYVAVISFLLIVISFGYYFNNYWNNYRIKYSSSWQYGYEDVFKYIKENSGKYSNIIITKRYGEPHIFYAFFNRTDPVLVQPGESNIRFEKSDWYWTDKINNIYFVNDWNIPNGTEAKAIKLESGGEVSTARTLIVTSPDHVPVNAAIQKQINFLDGSPAFIIASIP